MAFLKQSEQYIIADNKVPAFGTLISTLDSIYDAMYNSNLKQTEVYVNYWAYKENSEVILQVLDSYKIPYKVRRHEEEKNVMNKGYLITVGYNN
jgi:lysine/ornithine N-monooxygenase